MDVGSDLRAAYGRHMSNPVVMWQIISADPAVAANFYQRVFGWAVRDGNVVTGSDRGIGGSVWPAPPGVSDFVQLFVEVEDIDRTIDAATALGARVIVGKTAAPNGDFVAILHDPRGLSFGITTTRQ